MGLRALRHDVKDIRRTAQRGLPDPDLWKIASEEVRPLVTTDKVSLPIEHCRITAFLSFAGDSPPGTRSTMQ